MYLCGDEGPPGQSRRGWIAVKDDRQLQCIFLTKSAKIQFMAGYVVLGTWNTKKEELEFVCQEIVRRGHEPIRLDLSTEGAWETRDLAVADAIRRGTTKLTKMMEVEKISGMVAMGGGTNFFMACRVMENVPLMVPKVVVSTMIVNSIGIFGNYKDIVYLQSPCDFSALNPLSRSILGNAVSILTAMVPGLPAAEGATVAVTNMGISCGYMDAVKEFWHEKGWAVVPFHAVGESTMAMAELVKENLFRGVLDLSLHDVLDHLAQGAFGRLDERRVRSYLAREIPAVLAPGGADTIAYTPDGRPLPPRFRRRNIYKHDFRWGIQATRKEVVEVARWIGKVMKDTRPGSCLFLIPWKGWSDPGEEGGPFYDRDVIGAFKKQLMKGMREEFIIDVDLCLNDPRFGLVASQYLHGLVEAKWRT